MHTLNAVFTGQLLVKTAGPLTFKFHTDDGYIFSVGNGATRVSGDAMVNLPVTGPFTGYPVLSAVNTATPPTGAAVTVNFPAPGSYPFEVDYSECCAGALVLTMALTPITIGSQLVGTGQSLQVRL